MELFIFLVQVFLLTLAGALFPGPVSATAITMGANRCWAGALIGFGHMVLEFPLMVLIILGGGRLLGWRGTQITVGLLGGAVLLYIAAKMIRQLRQGNIFSDEQPLHQRPVLAGIVLSASNPYFLIWWVTIGLALATTAKGFGIWAFILFAIVHWLCDCGWLQVLSWASYKGSRLLSERSWRIVLYLCCIVMGLFGLKFIWHAVTMVILRSA